MHELKRLSLLVSLGFFVTFSLLICPSQCQPASDTFSDRFSDEEEVTGPTATPYSYDFEQASTSSVLSLTRKKNATLFSIRSIGDLTTAVRIISLNNTRFIFAAGYQSIPDFWKEESYIPQNVVVDRNGILGATTYQTLQFSGASIEEYAMAIYTEDFNVMGKEVNKTQFMVSVFGVGSCVCTNGYCEGSSKCVCTDGFINKDCELRAGDVKPDEEIEEEIPGFTKRYFYIVTKRTDELDSPKNSKKNDPMSDEKEFGYELTSHYFDGNANSKYLMYYDRIEISFEMQEGSSMIYMIPENYPEARVPSALFNDFEANLTKGDRLTVEPKEYMLIQSVSSTRIIICVQNMLGTDAKIKISVSNSKYKVRKTTLPIQE